MAAFKFGKGVKRPRLGFCAKVTLVVSLGLVFVGIWSTFSSPSSVVSSRRNSFGDIEQEELREKEPGAHPTPTSRAPQTRNITSPASSAATGRKQSPAPKGEEGENEARRGEEGLRRNDEKAALAAGDEVKAGKEGDVKAAAAEKENAESKPEEEEEEEEGGGKKEDVEIEEVTGEEGGIDGDLEDGVDVNADEDSDWDETPNRKSKRTKKKNLGPLFDPKARYSWKSCGTRKGLNYIPCIDLEDAGSGKFQGHRHHERSCPRAPPMCLVPLPSGYRLPVSWPDSRSQIFFGNVAHPKLSAYVKAHGWLRLAGGLLVFPHNESIFQGGAAQYFDFIDEMVPDIEWGKNIRIVLDIGSSDASFGAALLEKEVLTLSLGLMDDETDLAQVSLERGFPAVVGKMGTRRLPFPSGVFDAIHCGVCNVPWHSSGGKLLLEMNRILRPGGYFIMSFKHGDIEGEEGMSALTASICWNILAHRNDEDSDLGVKIYQRPSSNDIYELRRRNNPPLCKENEKQDAAWYTPIKTCLHTIPTAIEQRGTDWPEEWPKRLETFPEWLADSRERVTADAEHWKAIVNKSYLGGMGIDWSKVRNVMDMKAIYGGMAAALASQKVWVMNVVPVHAPNTLPVIFERGLLGIYHDWCEPFSTYPRSYDLLHADHLFARLKNRCMEATPSLACANKCVFCWRHHTNPVGRSWQWKMDDHLEIVNAAIDQHTKMIKQMKGVPGVKEEQLLEGLSPRHCALSLVGEPIMYPEINSLIDELHRRHISTFLVTNAQFPEKIKTLKPVTQLYVSVDAATRDNLKAIDRPLFGDFWERFIESLKALREKKQRTVYRLTLVKGWNAEDVDAYSNLLGIGEPDFIEIKGVTYCGSTATSKLTMENVPWHSDVRAFSEALAQKSNGVYEVACEHAHSCCVLLAKVKKFKIKDKWYTWIDYDKFQELVSSGQTLGSEDYMAETPSWAVYGAEEGGFDPHQRRYKKERRHGTTK